MIRIDKDGVRIDIESFNKLLESEHFCWWCNRYFPDKKLQRYGIGFLCDDCTFTCDIEVFDILDEFNEAFQL